MVPIKKNRAEIHYYTTEEIEYLREITPGRYNSEITKLFNKRFGLNLSEGQIKATRKRLKIKTGITGRFAKEHEPWNKGRNNKGFTNSGSFKKGHIPKNKLNVGDIRFTKDGYYEIKIQEPSKWQALHRYVYEKHYGKLEKTDIIVFLDGDSKNLDIDNLMCIDRKIHGIMNYRKWYSSNPEITKSRIMLAKIMLEKNIKKKQMRKERKQ